MGGRWLGKVQPLGSATEDKCSVTEGLGERPDHVFIKLEAAVKHPCVCIVRWTALTNEIINVLIAAAHRLGKHLWSLRWNDVAVRRTPTSSVWLHVIRSHGFLCLKRWLWGNIKSVLWFGFVICIYATATDRKWLPVLFTGLCDAAAAATNKLLFSIRNGHYQMWERPQVCDYSPAAKQSPGSHIIFNSNEMDRDKHTFKWELCTISHETKIFCAREWSTEIKRNVWMNAMYLSNCCLGMQVLSIEHQLQHWHFVIFYSVFWTLILHFKEAMNMFVSPASVV